jgi:hypothetical protein
MTKDQILTDEKRATGWLPAIIHHLVFAGWAMLGLLTLLLAVKIAIRIWDRWLALRRSFVSIEVTPPAATNKTPQATSELFSHIHKLGSITTLQEKLARSGLVVSFEIVGSKEGGIRYIALVPRVEAAEVRRKIATYLPNVRVKEVPDFLPSTLHYTTARVLDYRQTGAWFQPLKDQFSFIEHDPVPFLMSNLRELIGNEQIAIQLVLKPVSLREANIIAERIRRNENVIADGNRGNGSIFGAVGKVLFKLIRFLVMLITDLVYSSEHSGANAQLHHQNQVDNDIKPARSITTAEQEVLTAINDKVHQPLFRTEVRALIISHDKAHLRERTKSLNSTFGAFDTTYQTLRARFNFPASLVGCYRLHKFRYRLPSFFRHHSNILSVSEVADIYHFPTANTNIDNVVASYSRTLSAPLSLKQSRDFDIYIGQNEHNGNFTPIVLTAAERALHAYIIGATGMGKTTLIENAIVQDIRSGKGVGFIDPHGDAAKKILRYIPKDREKDIVYLHPRDIDFPIGFNPLDIDPALTGSERTLMEIKVVNMIVEALRKNFSDEGTGGHRIESMLRNGLLTAMTVEDATLFTVSKLIRNEDFRKSVVSKLTDERLLEFWHYEFERAGAMQQVSMSKGVTLKLDRYESDPAVGRILGQSKSTINFRDIIDNNKILICDFSKGEIGSDNASLLGTLILTFIQVAAEQRANIEQQDRAPFYLYVDEFQNFATRSFTEMASEARKYGLHLTVAEQTTSQIEDKLLLGQLLANVGTIITFRTGNPADENILLPFFGSFLKPGEINSLSAHNFYARISSKMSQPPVSGETILLDGSGSKAIAARIIEASQKTYGRNYMPQKPNKGRGDDQPPEDDKIPNPTKETR